MNPKLAAFRAKLCHCASKLALSSVAALLAFALSGCALLGKQQLTQNREFTNPPTDDRPFTGAGAANDDEAGAQPDASPGLNVLELEAGVLVDAASIDFNNISACFVASEIDEGVFQRINGRSYRENPDVALADLRYLKVLHYNFEHQIQVGELIVAASLAEDFRAIFLGLFEGGYEIRSLYLVDNYWTGNATSTDSASISNDNSSAFCYREITWGGELSRHAFGRAVDINPRENPYVVFSGGAATFGDPNAAPYVSREPASEHMISHDDLAFRLFTERGFIWGGDWSSPRDYQHFEKPL